MSLADGDVFAGYTVVRMLGSGGMGEVYLVRHPRLPRQDALKVLPAAISADPEFRSRFEQEADLAATLWHPHIVGVHDRGEDDGRLWIAMDFVEGHDAARLLREQWPDGMPVDEVITIVSAVADALDYAHDRQLLHRGVKPANILLTDDAGPKRRVLLADFGIARHSDGDGLTATNMTVGSVNYTAPEQLLGDDVDGRADQYALAATTYHLLTGTLPFPHPNPTVVISRHLNLQPPTLADTHPHLAALDPVVARALAKNREDRYPTAGEYAAALTDALLGTASSAIATGFPSRTPGLGFTPEPTSAPPVDSATAHTGTPAGEAPPVYVSNWGTTQHNADSEGPDEVPRVAKPRQPPPSIPSREGPPPVLIGVAIGIAIVLIAMITFVVLRAAADDSSRSAPPATPRDPCC